ncbi:MAG: FtsW/RodA/SpoVE family cell cycle protein [Lachnospiraceae bacterium]|nr:FtsW/RodA/SpoVE family cell cycle protein [Lachnospiraceae bacterium]
MDEYLKILLEQIRCKKARPYIRQELQNHIEDQVEANIHAGMSYERAEKEAVKDMGDPVEAGISLDRIHKPQIAWNLLLMIVLISITGIVTHMMIAANMDGADAFASRRYVIHVLVGITVMMVLYFMDYTLLARFSKLIATILLAICLLTLFFGVSINGMTYYMNIGGMVISIQALMLFYVPIYGGVIYQYHGLGYKGFMKAVAWMVLPILLVMRMPATMTAGLMMISMLVMLTIAVLKGWFIIPKKKTIAGLWGIFMVLPVVSLFGMYFGNALAAYQKARIQAFVSNSGDANYLTATIRSFLKTNKMIGSNGADISGKLPGFNADYLLTYLSSTYGMLVAILVCSVLAVLILFIFGTAMKQKNQLGMMMGCGCGMIFLVSFLINVLENLGVFLPTATFLPFLSAGGSYIVVSYGLIGIVLSIYRYKNVYPRHVKVKMPHIKMTIDL